MLRYVMYKVDEYLRRAQLARAKSKTNHDSIGDEYARIAKEWDDLAMERLSFLEQRVRENTLSWSECERGSAKERCDSCIATA